MLPFLHRESEAIPEDLQHTTAISPQVLAQYPMPKPPTPQPQAAAGGGPPPGAGAGTPVVPPGIKTLLPESMTWSRVSLKKHSSACCIIFFISSMFSFTQRTAAWSTK